MTTAASAQLSGSIAVQSDYRFRGVSLSDGKPDARASIGYDGASGVYGGASLTTVELEPIQRRPQWLAYVGIVRPGLFGLNWEVGVTTTHFDGDSRYDYSELFGGVIGERWSVRLYASPNYFGMRERSTYAEFNGSVPLAESTRAFGHAGVLTRWEHALPAGAQRTRWDASVGLGIAVRAVDLQLAWHAVGRGDLYAAPYEQDHGRWVLSAIYAF